MGGWCGTVNETLKAQITPSAAKVRHPHPIHHVNWQPPPQITTSSLPTSNHNYALALAANTAVVSYLVPTSNHNMINVISTIDGLYLI